MNKGRRVLVVLAAVAAATGGLGWALHALPEAPVTSPQPQPQPQPQRPPSHTKVDATAEFERYFRAGVEFMRQGRPHEALVSFMAARELQPGVPEVHVNMGFAHSANGDHANARKAFETALELQPRQANAYYGLAFALARQGDYELALGNIRTYQHFAAIDDPFRQRVEGALFEWSILAKRQQLSRQRTIPNRGKPS